MITYLVCKNLVKLLQSILSGINSGSFVNNFNNPFSNRRYDNITWKYTSKWKKMLIFIIIALIIILLLLVRYTNIIEIAVKQLIISI